MTVNIDTRVIIEPMLEAMPVSGLCCYDSYGIDVWDHFHIYADNVHVHSVRAKLVLK